MRRTLSDDRLRFFAVALLTLTVDWGSKRFFTVSSPFWLRGAEEIWGWGGLLVSFLVAGGVGRQLWPTAWTGPLALLVGGVWGNSLDRLIYHGVRDGLPFFIWTTNVADLAIWVGLLGLLAQVAKRPGKGARPAAKKIL